VAYNGSNIDGAPAAPKVKVAFEAPPAALLPGAEEEPAPDAPEVGSLEAPELPEVSAAADVAVSDAPPAPDVAEAPVVPAFAVLELLFLFEEAQAARDSTIVAAIPATINR